MQAPDVSRTCGAGRDRCRGTVLHRVFDDGQPVTGRRYPAADAPAPATIVLAHGAGAGQDDPFMVACARGLAARGLDAFTFNFPYMERRVEGAEPGAAARGAAIAR